MEVKKFFFVSCCPLIPFTGVNSRWELCFFLHLKFHCIYLPILTLTAHKYPWYVKNAVPHSSELQSIKK